MPLRPAIDNLLRGPVLPALVVVIAAVSYGTALATKDEFEPLPPPPPPAEAPYTDEARALLRGLDVGDVVQGWRVVDIHGPVDHGIEVRFERAEVQVSVVVARVEMRDVEAPLTTGPYGLYFSLPTPLGAMLEANAIANLSRGVSLRIDRRAPVPPGM